MESYVAREFDFDFIYCDLLFVVIWMFLLWRQRQMLAWGFGLAGACIVFLADDVLWFHIQKTRFIDAPINPDLFLVYFSFTYGMVMFSYAIVMFTARNNRTRLFWTVLLYAGWILSAFISQWISIDDRLVSVGRDMSGARDVQIAMVAGGYLLLIILKYTWSAMKSLTWQRIAYLFLIGILVHFGMEFTLWISGIRPTDEGFDVMIFNSLLEFNTGIPVLYIAWTFIVYRIARKRPDRLTPGKTASRD
jgi:hypothetical protein